MLKILVFAAALQACLKNNSISFPSRFYKIGIAGKIKFIRNSSPTETFFRNETGKLRELLDTLVALYNFINFLGICLNVGMRYRIRGAEDFDDVLKHVRKCLKRDRIRLNTCYYFDRFEGVFDFEITSPLSPKSLEYLKRKGYKIDEQEEET